MTYDEWQHSVDTLDGGFVSVYVRDAGGDMSIHLDRFDNDGTPVPSVSTVAIETANAIGFSNPDIAVSGATSVLISYEVERPGGTDIDIAGRVYNPVTDSFGAEFFIFLNTEQYGDPKIEVLANGNYAVVAHAQTATGDSISMTVLDVAGNVVVTQQAVGDSFTNLRVDINPDVAALEHGGFVVTWESETRGVSEYDVKFQIYDAAGFEVGSTQTVNDTGNDDDYGSPSITGLDDGGFVIFYRDSGNNLMAVQRYDASGNEVGNVHTIPAVGAQDTSIQQLDDGRLVLTYTAWPESGTGHTDVHVEIIDFRDTYTEINNIAVGTVFDDTLDAPSLDGDVYAGDGDDAIHLGFDGNYTGTIDGGNGHDTLFLTDDGSFNLRDSALVNIEELEFEDALNTPVNAFFNADQLPTGNDFHVDSNALSASGLFITIGADNHLEMDKWTFEDWDSGQDLLRVFGDNDGDFIIGSSQGDNILTYGGDDIVGGGAGDDNIDGGTGHDILQGGLGNDYLEGGSGNDSLYGDAGNDTLSGGGGFDTLDGGTGIDRADYTYSNADLTVDLAQGIAHLTGFVDDRETLSSIENVTMGGGDDTVIGNALKNVLDGGNGHDNLSGRGGDDTLTGGLGDDTLIGHSGNDTLNGGDGADTLIGNSGADIINGGDGNDILNGATGSDIINGGLGDDTIFGNNQSDTLFGNGGNDTIEGGAGADTINGGNNNDMLIGGAGQDTINGGSGADTLFGNSGGDDLYGDAGGDVLNGGGGNDNLWGGTASDTFVMDAGFGTDRIKDFQDGTDLIDLSGNGQANSLADVLADAVQIGNNVRVNFNANNILVIENFDLADLDATDFIF